MAADAGLPGRGGLTWRDRVIQVVLRPTTPPVAWGVAVAATLVAAELLVVRLLERVAPDSAFGALFLFGVLVVSAGGAPGSPSRRRWSAPSPTPTST